jgi:hypothetical protein
LHKILFMDIEEKDKQTENAGVATTETTPNAVPAQTPDTTPAQTGAQTTAQTPEQTPQTPATPDETKPEGSELTAEIEKPSAETPKVENLLDAVKDIFPEFELSPENFNGWLVETLNRYRTADARIDEVFENNPEFAEIMKRMYDGEDAVVAMASVISPEEYAAMVENGGAKTKEAREARAKQLKEIRDWEQSRAENISVSEQTVRQFQAETGKSDEEMMSMLDTLNEINAAMNDGKITKRELALIDKLLNADANAQSAADAAAIAARNQQIDAKKSTEFAPKGDGLPTIAAGGTPPENKDPLANSLFGGERKSVWS